MAAAPPRRYSIDDLDELAVDGKRRELVDGQIVEWDVTTYRHGWVMMVLGRILGEHVVRHQLGQVVGGDMLVRVLGSSFDARGPDVAFYARERTPKDLDASATMIAPDFVIEVLSPSDRAAAVQQKIGDWLRVGVRLLWYVDPVTGITSVYYGRQAAIVQPDELLDGADVVPGFSLRMHDVLEELAATGGSDDAGAPE